MIWMNTRRFISQGPFLRPLCGGEHSLYDLWRLAGGKGVSFRQEFVFRDVRDHQGIKN